MATFLKSANFNGKNGTHFQLNLYYDYTQSTANNQTTITYYLYFQAKDGYSGSGSTVTGYINSTSVGTTTSVGVNENKYIGPLSATITHNSDGTFPSTSYSAMIDTPWTLGDASVSGNITGLPTIPRASTPTLSSNNFNIGSSVTLTTNRKSTSFTHTVVLTFGSYTKTYTNVGDSQVINTSQFASNMYAQMPNAKSKTGTITTTTYNGGTQIGSASSLTFTANAVEGNVNPQISAITYSVDSTTSSLANSTTFIKGVTNATIRVTANRRMSATLTKVFLWYYSGSNKVVLSSQNVNADGTYTFTINGISVSKVYGGATDTRGYTTYNTSINNVPTTFKDYITLTADTNANIRRIVQTEPNVRINSFTGNYWNKSFGSQSNTLTIKWKYKETTASSYSAEYTIPASSISISNNKYTISNYTLTNGSTTELFNYQKSYHVQISVTDKIGTKTVLYTITAGEPNFAIFPSATKNNQNLIQGNHGIHFSTSGYIYWKETGYGDKFQIVPAFSGSDNANKLVIRGTVGGAGTDPTNWNNLMTISGKSGNVVVGTISGKNLLDLRGIIRQTKNGVTLSYDYNTGTVILNGTASAQTDFMLNFLNGFVFSFNTNYIASSTYVSGTTTKDCMFYMQDANHNWRGISLALNQSNNNHSLYYTDAPTTTTLALIRVPSGTTVSNLKCQLMIENTYTMSQFVPYQDFKNQEIYSNDEIVIGTFLGEKLYRKTIKSTKANIRNEINAITDRKPRKIYGFMQATNNVWMPLDNAFNQQAYNWTFWLNPNGSVELQAGSNFTDSSVCVVTIEYTKSTSQL